MYTQATSEVLGSIIKHVGGVWIAPIIDTLWDIVFRILEHHCFQIVEIHKRFIYKHNFIIHFGKVNH